MVYKNLTIRLIVSIILIIIFYFIFKNHNMILIIGTLVYFLVIFEIFKNFNKLIPIIIAYVLISFSSFYMYLNYYFDTLIFSFCIFIIVSFDSFSYFCGLYFGKTNIFIKISPKKTLEGYLGGIIITNFLSILLINFFNLNFNNINTILFINIIIIFSIFGDLIQSFFKRKNYIKDSSNYLPGHGGFFDRFDSFFSTIIFLYIFNYF